MLKIPATKVAMIMVLFIGFFCTGLFSLVYSGSYGHTLPECCAVECV